MDDERHGEELPKSEPQTEFKKPILVGRIGKLPKKAKSDTDKAAEGKNNQKPSQNKTEGNSKSDLPPAVLFKELSTPIPYKEPKWSGLCPDGSDYALEVLKSGVIVEKVELTNKAYYVFGRLANCDVVMANPTISRHHAVLQYKAFAEEGEPPSGWYIYDLGSTHGSFLNKERLKPSHYTRVRVGHQIKFGNSTRIYILVGPDFDSEGESELTVTEIKKRAESMKLERDRLIQQAIEQKEKDRLEEERKREEQGIDWGMGEDAEEEPDLADNPYAVTANEELYLDDPKKTLRGYFDREGQELEYDCQERGIGQFMCRVELPIDDARGNPVIAEVIHRGKKKEAVIACALEACRILDRAGLLRQAKHESRKPKQRDWSADDYYASDDDTFLDRTGSVERKRRKRMRGHKQDEAPATYESLLERIKETEQKISSEEARLERLRGSSAPVQQTEGEADPLDAYMSSLKQGPTVGVKADISNAKMNIQKLKAELAKTHRLAELARPAHMPPLLKKDDNKMAVKVASNSVVYGKRIRLKEDDKKPPKVRKEVKQEETEFVEEMDSDSDKEEPSRTDENEVEKSEKIVSTNEVISVDSESEKEVVSQTKKTYGPMRPPVDYVIPEGYFDQETDRDLPEIMEKDDV